MNAPMHRRTAVAFNRIAALYADGKIGRAVAYPDGRSRAVACWNDSHAAALASGHSNEDAELRAVEAVEGILRAALVLAAEKETP